MITLIKNGMVVRDDFCGFCKRDIVIRDDRITDENADVADKIIDAKGKYILPGLIDIHTHGYVGTLFADDIDFTPALTAFARAGVTGIAATVGVAPIESMKKSISHIVSESGRAPDGASIYAKHLEGPFVSSKKTGSMRTPDACPSVEALSLLADESDGLLRVMTIAPEVENAVEIIREGRRRGIRMSIGHTLASHDETSAAIDAGAFGATHLFNAMRPLSHRETGVLGALLTDDRVSCELICDLVHVSAPIIKLALTCKGRDGVVLVSDCGAQSGLGDGVYTVAGITRYVKDGVCTLADGTISGSTRNLADGARNLVALGVPLCDVSKMGSYNPARALGIDSEVGTVTAGKIADIIITDESFNVERVFVRGREFV